MDIKKLTGILVLLFVAGIGCAGNYGKLKNQSPADSKVTQQRLIEKWSDYHIWYKSAVIVFDPKHDNNTLEVAGKWATVKDQNTWSEIVRLSTTDKGNISPMFSNYTMTPVREIWSPDNQLYGYVIHQMNDGVSAKVVDDTTMRVYYHRARFGGP